MAMWRGEVGIEMIEMPLYHIYFHPESNPESELES